LPKKNIWTSGYTGGPLLSCSRPVGKHLLRDLRSCLCQLSPSSHLLLTVFSVKAVHGVRRWVSSQAHLYPSLPQLYSSRTPPCPLFNTVPGYPSPNPGPGFWNALLIKLYKCWV